MMSFWFGATLHDFLFKGFNITTVPGFLGFSLVTSALSFLLVLVTYIKEQLKRIDLHKQPHNAQSIQVGTSQKTHVICTFLTLCQTTLGYFLMLISMTFNAYLLMAIVIGSSLAYLSLNHRFANQFTSVPSSRGSGNTLQVNIAEERGSLIGNEDEATATVATAEVYG